MSEESSNPQTTEVTETQSEESLVNEAMSNLAMFQPAEEPSDASTEEVDTEDDSEESIELPEEETEQVEEEEQEHDSGLPIGVKKRIDKLTAQSKSKDDEIAQLKKQLEEAANTPKQEEPSSAPVSTGNDLPTDMQGIDNLEEQSYQIIEFCEDHLDEGVTLKNDQGEETYYSPEDLKVKMREARKTIRKLPKQRNFVKDMQQSEETAKSVYPELFDKGHAAYQHMQTMLRENPSLKNRPDYAMAIGDMMVGQMMRMKAQQEQSQPKKKAVPKAPVAPKVSRTPVETNDDNMDALFKRAASGDSDDLDNLIAAKLKNRKTA